jgi:hypothetical protein
MFLFDIRVSSTALKARPIRIAWVDMSIPLSVSVPARETESPQNSARKVIVAFLTALNIAVHCLLKRASVSLNIDASACCKYTYIFAVTMAIIVVLQCAT